MQKEDALLGNFGELAPAEAGIRELAGWRRHRWAVLYSFHRADGTGSRLIRAPIPWRKSPVLGRKCLFSDLKQAKSGVSNYLLVNR